VETLFLHGSGDDYTASVQRDGERVFLATLDLKQTDAGPRPGRFRMRTDAGEEPRDPDEFVELARRADRVRISEQTPPSMRAELRSLLSGYQLDEKAKAVRTCRICAGKGRYSPITDENAVASGEDHICLDCSYDALERELAHHGDGMSGGAADRLRELLAEVRDLDRIVDLLRGELDPDLTKFDTISATVDDIDLVPTSALDLHPDLQALLEDRFEELLPVQSLAVENDLLGDPPADQLVVSATATGKTLVGELAGLDRALRGKGKTLFLVPLVALANQKHEDFRDRYGHLVDVSIRVGASRIRGSGGGFDPSADVIVGTYEGIDHALRTGKELGDVGTVVIDEVHTLKEPERGHRLDGLIARLKHYCRQRASREADYDGAQWVYLSATVGNPEQLGAALDARLVEFEERPVPIERHLTFADGPEKTRIANRLVRREFDRKSSQGYRGQTIIFTNARRRCHEISRKLEYDSAAYHAGLDYGQRKQIERRFANQDLAAVVTTAALSAGVDFPASQVIFDALAMGIEWLSVQEFEQMLGRAGRPDYHDRGVVYTLVEPGRTYHGGQEMTEEEVAFKLLKGEMEPVVTRYDGSAAVEETLANVLVGGKAVQRISESMVGSVPTKRALAKLIDYEFVDGFRVTDLGRVVAEQFLSPADAFRILEGVRAESHPFEVVADLELADEEL
jgi:helicase